MSIEQRIQEARKKAKESSAELFEEKPEDIRKAFEEETTLGCPENLVKPDNKAE